MDAGSIAKREAQVISSVNRLETALNELEKMSQEFIARVVVILSPEKPLPTGDQNCKTAEGKAELAMRIDQSVEQARRITSALNYHSGRIEV
jgi:hypothetical protein